MLMDLLIPFSMLYLSVCAYFVGWMSGRVSKHSEYRCRVRAKLFNEILKAPPEKRLKKMLDMCFFLVAEDRSSLLSDDVLPEVYEHLENEMHKNMVEGGILWDRLPSDSRKDYNTMVSKVQRHIEDYREREREKEQEDREREQYKRDLDGMVLKKAAEVREKVAEDMDLTGDIDLEKGEEMKRREISILRQQLKREFLLSFILNKSID
ncbi:hypothetical protein BCIN_09g00890 [Botrytis cinerea B05.10]|uniref:Uncharacterized protein n=1 Tax=Botryotinia fuckeliana (strain B05.10) TaxID=332648 RepID=A0A384JRU1_BOTFB|nr:hypothetical protein BCIN_09g00890 [Botrytis cinerea B05.10]ATZ53211.1 hypothetical protein BCIN_09g00890 [Botrytis cinerea B05.10]